MPKSTLRAVFKMKYGDTIFMYTKKIRVQNAKKMLKEGRKLIDISYKVGYKNQSKFSKAFKDVTGMTPTAYKRDFFR